MSMHNILAKLAALVKKDGVINESAAPVKNSITEAAEKLEADFEKFKKDWEPEDEPRKPTEKEKAEDAELKAKGKETAKTLSKIASAFEKKKADESIAEGEKKKVSLYDFGNLSMKDILKLGKRAGFEDLEPWNLKLAEYVVRYCTKHNTSELSPDVFRELARRSGYDSDSTAPYDLKLARLVADACMKGGVKDPLGLDEQNISESDEEWTTGTGGRAVRKGHITTHHAGKGVYGGGKPYKHGDVDDDNDEDDKKPQAEPTAPKKRGRPKKVREAALREKAVSWAQQQAAAIAMHAPKSKLKGASKEMAKMPKAELEKFAKTKHKGLPKHVKESREPLAESLDAIAHRYGKEIRDFAQTGQLDEDLYHALYDYYFDDMPYGVKKARTADPYEWISDKLDEEIRMGEIEVKESNITTPAYGAAMTEEPIEILDTTMENFDELNELARLAGLNVAEAIIAEDKQGFVILDPSLASQIEPMDGTEVDDDVVWSSNPNVTAKLMAFAKKYPNRLKVSSWQASRPNQARPVGNGWSADQSPALEDQNRGSEAESKKDKPDFLDVDKDGDKDEPMKKALKDKEKDVKESVDECMGSMSPMGSMPSQDNISVNTNYSSADGRKSVSVTAEGEQAEALMQMLKLAGMMPGAGNKEAVVAKVAVAPHEVEVEEEVEYSNSPDEQYQGVDAIIHQGNDLNREKKQYAGKPKLGDNPMAEDVLALESKLAAEYESIKKAIK